MGYRLDFRESPAESLRRCARDRLEHAIAHLDEGFAKDPEEAVHEARKDVKKLRALLRLYRKPLGDTYRRENAMLRDAARELSSVRDADVLVQTLDKLAERFTGRLPEHAFATLREQLTAAEAPERPPESAVAEARDQLHSALARAEQWDAAGADATTLRKALRRTYDRGRAAFAIAEADPTDELLHDWRKRVKDLRYQQQLLRDAWPAVLKAQANAAQELAELLGDDHDLAVLDERARASGEPVVELDELLELVAQRRRELQAQAFALGRRVYAEPPKRFAARIGRYVTSATGEAEDELAA